jgi:pyridoxal phosphate enzyme (YggS family)
MPSSPSSDPAANLRDILARIAKARHEAIAPAAQTELVAISKGHDALAIATVIAAGQRIFGENRVQEAKAKWPHLRAATPGLALHLVGPLQTNKVREAVELFDVIQSVDRPKLADALAAEIKRSGRARGLFVQVNIGEEPQKAGVAAKDAPSFVRHCRDELGLPVSGLMCIPPLNENPAPHFALMQKLAREVGLTRLSMGMSDDFETAIKFGATHVRIGTAIFGARTPAQEPQI